MVQTHHYIKGEIITNQVLIDEDLKNVSSITSISTYFSPTFHRVPHKGLKGFPPFEDWSGKKLVVKHFKVFWSHEWVCIPSKSKRDLDPQKVVNIFTNSFT